MTREYYPAIAEYMRATAALLEHLGPKGHPTMVQPLVDRCHKAIDRMEACVDAPQQSR